MSTVAVVDIGSNSVCLLVAKRQPDGQIAIVDKLKDTPRLRDEIDSDGKLTEVGAARTLAALRLFAQVIRQHDAKPRIVATAALRAAKNGADFVARAKSDAGLDVEIVTGEEEARLAFLGALTGLGDGSARDKPGHEGLLHGTTLVADVGGGSSELVLGLDGHAHATVSEPIGALTVTRDWLGDDPVSVEAIARARQHVRETLEPAMPTFRDRPGLRAIATSGTIQRVARIACALSGDPRQDVHGMEINAATMRRVIDAMAAAPRLADRLRIPGMDPSRADILLGGALIYEGLTEALDLPQWTVSMAGLRMGVIHELLAAHA